MCFVWTYRGLTCDVYFPYALSLTEVQQYNASNTVTGCCKHQLHHISGLETCMQMYSIIYYISMVTCNDL